MELKLWKGTKPHPISPLTCRFFGRTNHTNIFCLLTPPHPVPRHSSAWEWCESSPFSPGLSYGPHGDWWRSGMDSCLPQKISAFVILATDPRAGFSFHFSKTTEQKNNSRTISHWQFCFVKELHTTPEAGKQLPQTELPHADQHLCGH